MVNLGYACINLSLKHSNVSTNRGMIKSTFSTKGHSYVSELVIKNLQDVITILKWNIKNDILVYRLSSSIFPWMSEYEIQNLPDFNKINLLLKNIGELVLNNNLRVGFHPGQFNVLCSPNNEVVLKTIKELNQHSEILNLMGLPVSPYYSINIHVGAAYNDKSSTLKLFKSNFLLLEKTAQTRLVIENDDKINMYTVEDLLSVSKDINVPITFDYFHHSLNPGKLSEYEALTICKNTWDIHNVRQLCHYSSSKQKHEDPTTMSVSHADWIYEKINSYDYDLDIECEAKQKDLAIINYRKRFN